MYRPLSLEERKERKIWPSCPALATPRSWWASGLEIFVMGAFTAAAAYLIGWIVELIVHSGDDGSSTAGDFADGSVGVL